MVAVSLNMGLACKSLNDLHDNSILTEYTKRTIIQIWANFMQLLFVNALNLINDYLKLLFSSRRLLHYQNEYSVNELTIPQPLHINNYDGG